MSGASALASARRRRASSQPDQGNSNVSQTNPTVSQNKSNVDQHQDQKVTPLQILQAHELKIRALEDSFNNKITDVVKSVIDERLSLYNDKYNTSIKLLQDQIIKLTSDTNTSTLNQEDMINTISAKMDSTLSQKLMSVNDTIKSILVNIEKLSTLNNMNDMNTNKINELINELNELKMLVIKNQTLSLETNNEMFKIQDKIKNIESNITEIKDSYNNEDQNMLNLKDDDGIQMLLKSMMESQFNNDAFSKLNIHDEDSIDNSDDFNNIDEIKLSEDDLNNIDEIKLSEDDLNNIKTDVTDELIEI